MGAGKTTVAGLLAEAWGVTARDTDADIEAAEGRTVADIFVDSGEPEFRRLERGRGRARRWPATTACSPSAAARSSTRRRASGWPATRWCSCGSASATP